MCSFIRMNAVYCIKHLRRSSLQWCMHSRHWSVRRQSWYWSDVEQGKGRVRKMKKKKKKKKEGSGGGCRSFHSLYLYSKFNGGLASDVVGETTVKGEWGRSSSRSRHSRRRLVTLRPGLIRPQCSPSILNTTLSLLLAAAAAAGDDDGGGGGVSRVHSRHSSSSHSPSTPLAPLVPHFNHLVPCSTFLTPSLVCIYTCLYVYVYQDLVVVYNVGKRPPRPP